MKSNRAYYWPNLIGLLFFLWVVASQVFAQTNETDNARTSLIRERIHQIMRETIKRGETMTSDGSQAFTRTFVPPSNEDADEVKRYGEKAVPILAEYLRQPTGFEKYHALRLLGAIGGKAVVEPLGQVALHDSSPWFREYALAFLTQAPWELAKPILQEAARSDADLRVRQRAKELLDDYRPR